MSTRLELPSEEHSQTTAPAIFRLKEEDIHEFQQLVHESCGVWMTPEDAAHRANALLSLAAVIIGSDAPPSGFEQVRTSSHLP